MKKLFLILSFIFIIPFCGASEDWDNPLDINGETPAAFVEITSLDRTGIGSIKLTWTSLDHPGITAYRVYRNTRSSGEYTKVSDTGGNTYEDKGLTEGSDYWYKVCGLGGDNIEAMMSSTQKINVSTSLTLEVFQTGIEELKLTWNDVGAVDYYIYRDGKKVGEGKTSSYTDSDISEGITYTYRVSGISAEGIESTPSNNESIQPSSVIANLSVSQTGIGEVSLSWDSLTGAASYKVYRSDDNGENYSEAGTSTSTSYTDTGLTEGSTYWYKVSGVSSSSAESSMSEGKSIQPSSVIANLSVSQTGIGEVSLSWDTLTGAAGYKVYRSDDNGENYSEAGTSTSTSYTDTGLTEGSTYWYKVSGVSSSSAESSMSEGKSIQPSSVIANLSVSQTGIGEVSLSWDAVSYATGYKVYYDSDSSGPSYSGTDANEGNSPVDVGNVTTKKITGLTDGSTYYFAVVTYADSAESGYSDEVSWKINNNDMIVDMGTYYIDKYEASRPDATETSVGSDNSVAYSIPGVLPWVSVNWNNAKAACEARGTGWGLCSASEWGDTCDGTPGDGGYTYPYGDTYEGSTCNGNDAGNGKAVPTGSMTGCKSVDGIYDMSGNVWEWTEEVSGDSRVIRGGSWNSGYSNYLACSYRSSSNPADTYGNIGFRCCQDK